MYNTVAPLTARLSALREMASDPIYSSQKKNIATAIQLPDVGTIWLADGKVLKKRPTGCEEGVAL